MLTAEEVSLVSAWKTRRSNATCAGLELQMPVGMCDKEDLNVFFGLGMEDRCPVCGDHVSGYHYGLQTCESCKGFFKRTVQNKKVYTCADSSDCLINKAQRKNCPYCRFRKCLDVGMKIEAVRENRVRGGRNKFGPMYKYHRALKLQAERYRQQVLMQIGTAFLQSPYSAEIVRRFCGPEHKMAVEPSASRLSASHQQTWPPGPFIDDQTQSRMVLSEMHRERRQYDGFSRTEFDPKPQESFRQLTEDADVFLRQRPSPQKPMPNLELLHPVSLRRTATVGEDYRASQKAVSKLPESRRNRSHSFPNLETLVDEAVGSKYPSSSNSSSLSGLDGGDGLIIPKVDVDEIDYTEDNCAVCSDVTESKSVAPPLVAKIPIAELMGSTADYEVICAKFRAVSEVILQDFKDAFIGRYDQPVLVGGCLVVEELRPLLIQLFCRLCDQALFLMVEWVRAAPLFKQLKVEDQIKLIENCWSEILVIDLLYHQTRHDRADHLLLMSGHLVSMDVLELVGVSDLKRKLLDLILKMKSLDLHHDEVTCLKFLVLLNPDVGGLCDQSLVEKSQEKVSNALMDYCSAVNCNRFGQLLMQLPEIQVLSLQVEDYLQRQCLLGRVPSKSILAEMLMSSSHR